MQEALAVTFQDAPMLKANSHELRTMIEKVRGTNVKPPKNRTKAKAQKQARRVQRGHR